MRNWGARLLAPLVFFAAVTVLVLLVQSALDDPETSSTPPPAETQPGAAPETGTAETGTLAEPTTSLEEEPPQPRNYTVRSGDTLESIAERFDTDVETLLTLNPDIDPLALTVGQKIRVR